MKTNWLRRIGGEFGMAVTWAVIWGLVGVMIAVTSGLVPGDPMASVLDPWLALAMPGFIGGVIFCVVLRLAERSRRVHEVSLPRLAVWGAVAGLLLGVFPLVAGSPSGTIRIPLWLLAVAIIGSTTLLSAVSAVGSALLFRYVSPA